jgi:hypothetical protein
MEDSPSYPLLFIHPFVHPGFPNVSRATTRSFGKLDKSILVIFRNGKWLMMCWNGDLLRKFDNDDGMMHE